MAAVLKRIKIENGTTCILITECVCVICVLALFSLDVGLANIFSWHPIFMTTGFVLLMSEGLLAYYRGDLVGQPRSKSRGNHAVLMLFSFGCVAFAFASIYIAHAKTHHSQVGHPDGPLLRYVHVLFGYFVIICMVAQVLVGIMKKLDIVKLKLHGRVGPWIYGFGMSNISMGLVMWEGKTVALQYSTAVLVAFVAAAVFVNFVYSRNSRRLVTSELEKGESIELIEGDR